MDTTGGFSRLIDASARGADRPIGDRTTLIDLADRDEMDDDMFPLTAKESWFTRDKDRRTLNHSTAVQEFVHKGTAEFGNRLVFEIGSVQCADLLFAVALQIRLGHWLPDDIVQRLRNGQIVYQNEDDAWGYANSLGTSIIERAEFILEDQTLEIVDGDFANVIYTLFSDVNTQFGVGTDAFGRRSIPELMSFSPEEVFPTTNGIITCILPFSFQRTRLRNGFPMAAVKPGTLRVAVTLRPFYECVRQRSGIRSGCRATPLGQTFTFYDVATSTTFSATASSVVPAFEDIRMLTYGVFLEGKLRNAIVRAPFDRIYRDVQTFRFAEPLKYVVLSDSAGTLDIQLPLEINNPVEEIIWFVRRKAVDLNNEWINYSNTLEHEYDPTYRPFQSMLVKATFQVNGSPIVEGSGTFFQREIASYHKGGIVAFQNFVYGYSFANKPGQHNPSGWLNASRSTDCRLRLTVRPPGGLEDGEWEVVVFVLQINWVRFQNGIANRVYSS